MERIDLPDPLAGLIEREQEVKRRYVSGEDIPAIARKTDFSRLGVAHTLGRLGVPLRPVGRPGTRRELIDSVRIGVALGKTVMQIAEATGITGSRVRQILKEHFIESPAEKRRREVDAAVTKNTNQALWEFGTACRSKVRGNGLCLTIHTKTNHINRSAGRVIWDLMHPNDEIRADERILFVDGDPWNVCPENLVKVPRRAK